MPMLMGVPSCHPTARYQCRRMYWSRASSSWRLWLRESVRRKVVSMSCVTGPRLSVETLTPAKSPT